MNHSLALIFTILFASFTASAAPEYSTLTIKEKQKVRSTGTVKEVIAFDCNPQLGCALLVKIATTQCLIMDLDLETQQSLKQKIEAGKSITCVLDPRVVNMSPRFYAPNYAIVD